MSGDAAHDLDPEFPRLAPAVVEAYRNAPPTMMAEVLAGELSLLPRPRRRHARSAGRLGAALDGPFDRGRDGPGGWLFLPEPELHLGSKPDIVIPELAGWRRERLSDGFLDEHDHLALAPDWVCEVLSPSTEKVDREKKLPIYRRERVQHTWLIDPVLQTLEVFRRHDLGWLLIDTFSGDLVVRAEPFEAVDLELAALWSA